jgi:molybdopterin-guanine dinucleotide biosynthesis protein A
MAMKFNHTEAIVLSGGRGERMGGCDKGLVELCGKPLVRWVTDSVAPQVDAIILSVNRNLEAYKELGYPVVVDEISNFQGPLAGIAAALREVKSEYTLVVPTDSPQLPSNLCSQLGAALVRSNAEIAVVEYDGQIQPVLMLFRSELKSEIEQWLKQGSRKVLDWIKSRRFVTVPFSGDELYMVNINDDEGLAAASSKLCS